ncbi:T-lymphocyte surface antigen Ly-9-like [Solea senegalensis]|uniref:T-lymphocyte surface antigen Ly-9-like n=1 Tax=Solea senegalensis TaxID=28829 RepID=A0AAV6R9C9_SOLSE|nr:carcinoembryonic antigen-related cell adhesion molecule 3-like isoform X2 [Solea senegalensis]KAG7502019.1 T-lymphocyte surface antigen Ly-9-like [Solea senegalensis]
MFWTVSLTVLLCFLDMVSTQSEITLYKKVGDDVILTPPSVTAPITSITWKVGLNMAVQWDDSESEVSYYRHFKERGRLNISSGGLTIAGVTRGDSEVYTPEINGAAATPIRLIVISPVPVPTVTVSCDDAEGSCVLTCSANTTGAEPHSLKWKSDDSELTTTSNVHHIEKEKSLSITQFSCELDNPVSRQSSGPIFNPFNPKATRAQGNLNISAGLVVFISLLSAVLLLVFVHRCKTGDWFFQKEYMPWTADFWRKKESTPEASATNGTTARQENRQEETARNQDAGDDLRVY